MTRLVACVKVATVLYDDGTHDDVAAGDGTYSVTTAAYQQPVGPRTLRVKVEARRADGRRHANAADVEPFHSGNPPPVPALPLAACLVLLGLLTPAASRPFREGGRKAT